jgi:hypothetical protein
VELPVLTFVQQKVRAGKDRRSVATLSVLCLDKRTGRSIFEATDLPRGAGVYSIEGDPSRDTVTLSLPSATVVMSFTDEPTAPQAPYQQEQQGAGASRDGAAFWGVVLAIPRALVKAAEQREDRSRSGVNAPLPAAPPVFEERHDDD